MRHGITHTGDVEMIKTVKEYEGTWTVWNMSTMEAAEIIRFTDYFMGRARNMYRVDKGGRTEASMLDTFAQAKSAAAKLLK